MNWKRLLSRLAILFVVSLGSSLGTWYVLTQCKQTDENSWDKVLNLTPEQKTKFSSMESEFNALLKEMTVQDAQNKVSLCNYLHSEKMEEAEMDSMTQKMGELYIAKQKKIVKALASISDFLTPEQRKIFSNRLLHEICVSCRKATGIQDCLCGMCEHKT